MSDFKLNNTQVLKLESAIHRCGGNSKDVSWLCKANNFLDVLPLIRGKARLLMHEKVSDSEKEENTIVTVKRNDMIGNPSWLQKFLSPKLQVLGPNSYDLAKVILWTHPDLKGSQTHIKAQVIYDRLVVDGLLKNCLTRRDGLEIIKTISVEDFLRFFFYKELFLWGSVAVDGCSDNFVPTLSVKSNEILMRWIKLDYECCKNNPAVFFPK